MMILLIDEHGSELCAAVLAQLARIQTPHDSSALVSGPQLERIKQVNEAMNERRLIPQAGEVDCRRS